MLQFYFLSVFLNILAGYLLIFGEEGVSEESKNDLAFKAETFRLIVGVLSAFTGLTKLFSPLQGNIPVIGDLIPAVSGIVCGFVLLFDYYRNRTSVDDSEHTKRIDGMLVGNKRLIGAVAFVAAVLHFLFPRVPLI